MLRGVGGVAWRGYLRLICLQGRRDNRAYWDYSGCVQVINDRSGASFELSYICFIMLWCCFFRLPLVIVSILVHIIISNHSWDTGILSWRYVTRVGPMRASLVVPHYVTRRVRITLCAVVMHRAIYTHLRQGPCGSHPGHRRIDDVNDKGSYGDVLCVCIRNLPKT